MNYWDAIQKEKGISLETQGFKFTGGGAGLRAQGRCWAGALPRPAQAEPARQSGARGLCSPSAAAGGQPGRSGTGLSPARQGAAGPKPRPSRGKAEGVTERLEAEEGEKEGKAMKLQTEGHEAALGQWRQASSLVFIIKDVTS